MSVHEIQRFLFETNRDPARSAAYRDRPKEAVSNWPGSLTADEQRLLADRDVVGLYRHGVHGVLLAVSSATLGITPPELRRRLKEAYGLDELGRPSDGASHTKETRS